ncbi:MAG: THUMP domain-containing protein [Polyangiaceae bacterium]
MSNGAARHAEREDTEPFLFFATAAAGTEGAVRDELRELGFRGVRADRGGVHFRGAMSEGFRACLWLRCAVRVLLLVAEHACPDEDALYEGVASVDWSTVLDAKKTLAVRAFSKHSALTHTQYIAQRTKDAVVDQLRDRHGERPDVNREDPDVLLFVHLAHDRARVYLDLSGESLHLRGYRRVTVAAPLKESLAAALLRLSEWDRERPLVDPMCGSGTLAIEAAAWSRDMAPGLSRKRFGFERWRSHGDAEVRALRELREEAEARANAKKKGAMVWAFDADRSAVEAARANARAAGLDLRIDQRPIDALEPLPSPGHVIVNPPYDERLPGDAALYDAMAGAFRRMAGHRIAVLAGAPEVERALPRRATKVQDVHNGPIRCKLFVADVP